MKVNNAINRLIFNKIITIVNILSITRDFFLLDEILDENLENKNMLNPIQEEDHLTEEREKSECAKNNNTNKDACQEDEDEDDDEDTKYKFPDTQIKIDLSGPK